MPEDRRRPQEQRLVWMADRPPARRPRDRMLCDIYWDGHGLPMPERRADADTVHALEVLLAQATARQVKGLAVVALHPDGSHDLVLAGCALAEPYRTAGALARLANLVDCVPGSPCRWVDPTEER